MSWCDFCNSEVRSDYFDYITYKSFNREGGIDDHVVEACPSCQERIERLTTCEVCECECPIDLEGVCENCADIEYQPKVKTLEEAA